MVSPLRHWCSLQASQHNFSPLSHKKLACFGPLSSRIAPFARASEAAEKVKQKKKKDKAKKDRKKAGAADPGESERDRHRFDSLVEKALSCPPPLRFVKEKERLREKEMEKYGLMTKERQIEVEQEKAREKAKKKAAGTAEEAEAEPPLTAEEGMRLAKEYSRLLMQDDRKRAAGETLRLRLKKEAIEALPPQLKEAALVPDLTPFPGLGPATLTPPIPGFVYEFETRADDSKEERL